MATNRLTKLSDRIVRAAGDADAADTGQRILWDGEIRGFGLRITKGARSFIFNYRASGRERRLTIGKYPAWSVEAAREEAKELRKRVDRGQDPMAARHADRASPTVDQLADRFVEEHLSRRRPSYVRDSEAMLRRFVRPKLGKIKVENVTYTDVDRLHRSLKATPYQANRMLALLSKMFGMAERWQMRRDNPCRGIEKFDEAKRERYLTGDERAALLIAMQEHAARRADYAQTVRALRLAMLTGSRIGEAMSARWDQFSDDGRWTKPAATTKQRKDHRIALNAPARQLLEEIREKSGTREWLFPNADGDGPQVEYKGAWRTIRERATVILWADSSDDKVSGLVRSLRATLDREPRYSEITAAAEAAKVKLPAGLADFRVHDLRHNFASEGASIGLSLPMIGALLGHTNPATTARYAHLMDDPLAAAAEQIGSRLVEPVAERRGGAA